MGCNDTEELNVADPVSLLVVSIAFFDSFSPTAALEFSAAGVLDVFDDPKLANAPEPKPKAKEALALGDATAALAPEARLLKGFDFPCDDVSPPSRFEDVKDRGESVFDVSLLAENVDVDNESLPLLEDLVSYRCGHHSESLL